MRIGFKSLYYFTNILFLILIEKALSKEEWSYFGVENQNDQASIHRRKGDSNSDEANRNIISDKSVKAVTENGRTSSVETNDDPNGALPLPSNVKAENESTEAKDNIEKLSNIEKNAFEDNRIMDDPDPGFTVEPDVKSGTGYKKYNNEKISYTQGDLATSWPLGIIPYYVDLKSYDHILANRVREVMDSLESASCVQFKPLIVKPEEKQTWIHITNPNLQRECVHRGMHQETGEVRMVLGLDCLKRRDILHTLLHAMGFMDEVSHPHRDQFVRIMWNNIQPKYQKLFSIASSSTIPMEYDPLSIMHFHDRAFTKNGHATIVPLMPGLQIQPSDKLSQLDKMKLRLAFGHECNRRTVDNLLDTCKTVLHEKQKNEGGNGLMNAPKLALGMQLRNAPSGSDYEDAPQPDSSKEKTGVDRTAHDPEPDSSTKSPRENHTELESFELSKEKKATYRSKKVY